MVINSKLLHRLQEDSVIENPPRPGLRAFDNDRLRHFETFVAGFRSVFHRADQSLRFRAYLRGLLEPMERKNIEAIAAAAGQAMMVESDLAQALQHFVSHSPWDYRRLFAAVRKQSAELRNDPDAVWVVHDAAFPKKGQHSVGVHRQFARGLGKKLNCQIGVFIAQLGPKGYFPLAAQLYLPALWLKENGELAAKTIPESHCQQTSKIEIALSLLDELKAEGEVIRPIAAESGYAFAEEFADGLKSREMSYLDAPTRTDEALTHLEWLKAELGLDHLEVRTWHGWHHHVSLVFTAYHLLADEGRTGSNPPFSSLPR